ncbi:hypothetical protein N473_02505 [Pseudoalteromonas luteoviolacea CPMOR-1]|uniref:Uncharacterized protein n=1 Tax=Pseudoalteromonas luteoviolacea CPMOR-1 TaxID=1365248 RepID=A0A167IPV8_9GAMM|nr:hypothetical protein [Pseudoalteromonas luteoviolacea]KZN59803.1 hypothetical protein N473_02505 [Pseudoalteromonas luteoviolacea CPMOR-1]
MNKTLLISSLLLASSTASFEAFSSPSYQQGDKGAISQLTSQQLYKYKDSLCALQIVNTMVLDGDLQSVTSTMYPLLNSTAEHSQLQKEKLKNLYYVPYSEVSAQKGTSIHYLIEKAYGPITKLTNVYLSNSMADQLVAQTASYDAQAKLTLTLGNAAVRTALTPDHGIAYEDETKLHNFSGDNSFILNSQEQKNLALLMFSIANNKTHYDRFQALLKDKDIEEISNNLTAITLPNQQSISKSAADKLASLTVKQDHTELVSFIGTNIYKPSW